MTGLCVLTTGLFAALVPAAQAATSVVSNPGVGGLTITAAPGSANDLTVDRPNQLVVSDTGDTVSAGNGCTAVNASTVSCSTAGIFTIVVSSGDRDDRITYNASGIRGALVGDAGNDVIRAGASAPSSNLFGGAGNDTLSGGAGDDFLDGGDGSDVLSGGGGNDLADYRARTTSVIADIDGVADDGAAGERDNIRTDVENIDGGDGNDTLTGNAAANRLDGLGGNDVLSGLGGNDRLSGDGGNDTLNGGDGDDSASYSAGADGSDRFSGGAGHDTASYGLHASPVSVSLDGVANDGVTGENDNNLSDVEDIIGTAGSDTLTGNASNNVLSGDFGSDVLNGLGGHDRLNGDAGNDTLNGGDGNDSLEGGPSDDALIGGNGDDELSGGLGPQFNPDGGSSDTDVLDGGAGSDAAVYASRSEGVVVDPDGVADDGRPGSGENDNVRANVEDIFGGAGDDTLVGNRLANNLFGLAGSDTLRTVDGISGNDSANGGIGIDTCVTDSADARVSCEE